MQIMAAEIFNKPGLHSWWSRTWLAIVMTAATQGCYGSRELYIYIQSPIRLNAVTGIQSLTSMQQLSVNSAKMY